MTVKGFKTAAIPAGIKAKGELDLALIYSDTPATTAAVFTQNTFIAAPLIVSKVHLKESNHRIRAVLVNSGNANAATGEAGIQAAQLSAAVLADRLGTGARIGVDQRLFGGQANSSSVRTIGINTVSIASITPGHRSRTEVDE